MAGGNVKKGFGTYLFILLFMILLAFLLVVVIMILSPSKNILGFKYFANRKNYSITTTSAEEEINYSALTELNLNTDYAEIIIERDRKVDTPQLRVEVSTYGFAKEKDNTDFSYEVNFVESDNARLNVKLNEPQGFLYLQKNIKVRYLLPVTTATSLENTQINVVNNSGRLYLGNAADLQTEYSTTNFKSVNFKTNSGTLYINKFVGENVNELFFKSEKGGIQNSNTLTIQNRLEVYSTSGNIKLGKINYSGTDAIKFDLKNAKLSASEINGNVDLEIDSGYVDIDKLNGNLSSSDALSQMNKATINIKEVAGNISLPYANSSTLHFGKIADEKQVYINGTNGNITIDEMNGGCWIETQKGNVNVNTNSNDIWVKTTTGKINVKYNNNDILDSLNFISQKGEINLRVKPELKFILKALNSKGELRGSANIKIEFYDKTFSNPLVINNGTKYINMTTNGRIYIGLI